MGKIFLLLCFFSIEITYAQVENICNTFFKINFNKENTFFIVGRGTKSKSTIIANKFNVINKNLTHIGIGVFVKDSFLIYNVSDTKNERNCFIRKENLKSFLEVQRDTYYAAIWKCTLSSKILGEVIYLLDSVSKRNIVFDSRFNIKNDDTLYCSEFCAYILNNLISYKFNFHPTTMQLKDGLIKSYFQKEELIYFPVDFFAQSKKIKKIIEANF